MSHLFLKSVQTTDTDASLFSFFIDEDSMVSNSATKVPSQQSVKAYVDSLVASPVNYQGGYNASTNSPDLDTSPSGVSKGDMYTVTAAGTFFTISVEIGDVLIAEIDSASVEADWTVVQANLTAASIKTQYESNADTNAFTDALLSKLNGIEASADVTDATNVDAAGAVMNSDTSTASMSFVVDEDDMASDLNTKVPTQQSVKAYVDSSVKATMQTVTGTTYSAAFYESILADDTSNAITVNLPAAASNAGKWIEVKKVGNANDVTIDGSTTETIDGAETKVLSVQYESVILRCDGSNWYIF